MSDREAMKLAYGLLWLDGEPSKNGLKFAARLALRECLSKEERKEAIRAAVDNHYNRPEDEKARDAALHKLFSIEPALVEHEAPEDSFVRDAELTCPVCGGSGHKGDITPEAIAMLANPLEWIDESGRWGKPSYKAKDLPIVLRKSSEILRWEFVTEYATHFISVNEADFDEAVVAADKHYRADLAKHFDTNGEQAG